MSLRRLADVDADGRLSRDEFAVALYLIQSRESGQELPQVLPASLVPPSSRRGSSSGSGSGSQTPQFPQPSVRDEPLVSPSIVLMRSGSERGHTAHRL